VSSSKPQRVSVLHIEDDQVQRLVMSHHLVGLPEYRFDVAYVDSEDAAVELFERRGADLVILDYQLTQGNGLSCLQRLRRRDALVPIMAVSGVATPEMAVELLHAGADEYFNKQGLDAAMLARSIRHMLTRTAGLRNGELADLAARAERVQSLFRHACAIFTTSIATEFFEQLDALEGAARETRLGSEQMQQLLEAVCLEGDSVQAGRLRPVLLEALVRLFGQAR
jgi:DNA-binding response OmpR family regulator